MPLSVVRQESAGRLREVLSILGELKKSGAAESSPSEDPSIATKKGLFFVILYASFEYAVTRTVSEVVNQIQSKKVCINHLEFCMHPLALDSEFVSISSPSKSTKWDRRSRLFTRQNSSEPADLNEFAVTADLGNVWCSTLQQLFLAFGLTSDFVFHPSAKQYIDELVNNRNKVAHGRESAAAVGRSYTVSMLERRLEQIEQQKEYVFTTFECLLMSRAYVRADVRSNYMTPV